MYPNNQQNNMYNQGPNGNMYYINQMQQQQQPMEPVRQGKGAGPLPIVILLIIILLGVFVYLLIQENNKKDDSEKDKTTTTEKEEKPEEKEPPVEDEILIHGTWICDVSSDLSSDDSNKFVITFNESDFTWYDKADPNILTVKGTYTIKKVQDKAEGSIKSRNYTLDLVAKERIIDGARSTQEMTNEYELGVSAENHNSMAMINTQSYNLLYCVKE